MTFASQSEIDGFLQRCNALGVQLSEDVMNAQMAGDDELFKCKFRQGEFVQSVVHYFCGYTYGSATNKLTDAQYQSLAEKVLDINDLCDTGYLLNDD